MNQISPEELERIERFVTGQMEQNEAGKFEEQLAADITLREKTEEIKLLLLGIREQSLREQLKQLDKKEEKLLSKNSRVIFLRRNLLLVASILLIVGLTGWWLFADNSSNEKRYSQFYKPDPGLATVMGNSDNYDFEKAMVEYKNEEYNKALAAWNILLKKQPANDTLLYFTAMAYQAKGDCDSAITNLQPVAENIQSAFNKDACWYLGLCWLKKKENQKAIGYIQRSAHPQKETILKVLNKK
jgi:hypothetical protein